MEIKYSLCADCKCKMKAIQHNEKSGYKKAIMPVSTDAIKMEKIEITEYNLRIGLNRPIVYFL